MRLVFTRRQVGAQFSSWCCYVDDILLIGNDILGMQATKAWLGKCFSMKGLGDAVYILGIKIYRDRARRILGLSQGTYINKVLKRFKMHESKKEFLPMRHGIHLSKDQCASTPDQPRRMKDILYASSSWVYHVCHDLYET